jgi:Na+/H+ antiporter NhaD/arsenite permease-like protein
MIRMFRGGAARWSCLLCILLVAPLVAGCNASPTPPAAASVEEAAADNWHSDKSHSEELGHELHVATVLPFVVLLLCIAILPLATPHWWEHNTNKAIVVVLLSLPISLYMNFYHQAGHHLLEKVHEYISFIVLLASLYVISGGVYVRGSLNGTPLANTALIGLGSVIASIIGTTGASVLLIRPLLRANKTRVAKAHIVVFFIFAVSNCGGLLTPLGDPPLFLGFLKGVPFEWTAIHLWPQWLFVNIALLVIFNIYDQIVFAREERDRAGSQLEQVMKHEPIGVDGMSNFLFLAGIVLVIVISGQTKLPLGLPEGAMLLLALAAYFTTSLKNRERNNFSFGPINEVAILFIGIFVTMTPALLILNAWGQPGDEGRKIFGVGFFVQHPWQYFWASGVLSSFLDNAPTYLAFAAPACGKFNVAVGDQPYLYELLKQGPEAVRILEAISCGAVFMGANTYIGNGPNFMVKAIAEENGVKMPSFFGYMAYSGAILIPIFIVVTFVFFMG